MSSHGGLTKGLVPTRDGVEKPISVFESDRHVAGEPVRLLWRVSQGPRGHPDRTPERQGVGRSRDRRTVSLVPPEEFVSYLVSPLRTEIQVHVRWILSAFVEEPLKEQSVREGFRLGQSQAIGDDGVGRAAPPGHGGALTLGYPDGLVR